MSRDGVLREKVERRGQEAAELLTEAELRRAAWLEERRELERNARSAIEAKRAERDASIRMAEVRRQKAMASLTREKADQDDRLSQQWEAEREVFADRQRQLAAAYGWADRAWDDPEWYKFEPVSARSVPEGVRCGHLAIAGPGADPWAVPALLPIIGGRSLFIDIGASERTTTAAVVQSILLRLFASLPPSKVRFLFIDPVGLGANVASMLGLPNEVYSGKVWTEPNHIDQQLVGITSHMETVIQTYLQDKFTSLEQYNTEKGGQVAEAYRIVVAYDFPSAFNDTAFRRLLSIVRNGTRTGVYAIIIRAPNVSPPHGCSITDITGMCNQIRMTETGVRLHIQGAPAEVAQCPLVLDALPPQGIIERISESVVEAAKQAGIVRLPYQEIALPRERWWADDEQTVTGIRTPVGLEGVSDHLNFRFDDDTVHGLMVGRTGSGKSTLLHALILGLSTRYAPKELALYFVDFKKGIEFKSYATHGLPHARVIAIESEREFGLSILRKLDSELERRGEIFRNAGVNNIRLYRDRHPTAEMARILLIVDEFHEFFSDDDELAHEAARLMDRIVRQGRSFGVHMLLASQNLGTHSLHSISQGTLDQMAIRIALRCTEADSRRILGDDNSAARLLNRPGQAIYNDANGLIEGNRKFQVVWLPDEERERLLNEIAAFGRDRRYEPDKPMVIFEGNEAARLAGCEYLRAGTEGPRSPEHVSCRAWIGEPISIDPPIAVPFPAFGGRNVLVVGRNEDIAAGLFFAHVATLVASAGEEKVRIRVLDLSGQNSGLDRSLRAVSAAFPQRVELVDKRKMLHRLAALHRRWAGEQSASDVALFLEGGPDRNDLLAPSLVADSTNEDRIRHLEVAEREFLCIFGVHRLRELRGESDYVPSEPGEHWTTVLREGPENGVHMVVWADSHANLERWSPRAALQQFGVRIALQMTAGESDGFIGIPSADDLGRNFALVADEERGGAPLRIRPYALPNQEELEVVLESLKRFHA